MATVKQVHVQIKGFENWKRRVTDRGLSYLASWAAKAIMGPEIYGKTPVDTGELRANTDTRIQSDRQNLIAWFYWKQSYAKIVEEAWYGRGSPRTPGTRAPFAKVGVYEAAQTPGFRAAIKKMLEG